MKSLFKKLLFLSTLFIGVNHSFAQITISSFTVKDVTCNGGNDGEITIVTSGAKPGATLTYNIVGASSFSVDTNVTTLKINGLKAGSAYVIVVQDQGNGSSDSKNAIVINSPQGAKFTYPSSSFCKNASNPSPTFPSSPYPGNKAGTFSSSPAGLVINSATGQIDLTSSSPGTYTVTNTIAANGNCSSIQNTQSVTINSAPSANFTFASSPYCNTSSNPTPMFSSGATAGVFSASLSGLNFVSTSTGQIDLTSSLPGTYTVTNTIPSSGGCSAVNSISSVTINRQQNAGFKYSSDVYCIQDNNQAPILNIGATVGVFSSSPAGLSISPTTGQLNLSISTVGTYTVSNTIPASGGCSSVNYTQTIKVGSDCGQVTGIDVDFLSENLVYPNPAKNQLNVNGDVKKVIVFNQLKEVLVSELNVININELPLGIYFIKIIYADDSVRIEKIVKE